MTSVNAALGHNPRLSQANNLPVGRLNDRQILGFTNRQIRMGLFVLSAIAVIEVARRFYNFYRFDQMTEVNCPLGVIDGKTFDVSYYHNVAENNNVEASLCLAKMYKTGKGVAQSLEAARTWFQKAASHGLYLAKKELCKSSLYADWTSQQRHDATRSGYLANLCCPGLSICPWMPVFAANDKYSTDPGRIFGKRIGD